MVRRPVSARRIPGAQRAAFDASAESEHDALLAVASAAGNQAFATVAAQLARATSERVASVAPARQQQVSRAPPKARGSARAELRATAERLQTFADRAGVRHDRLADLASAGHADLQASSVHLTAVTANYEKAWNRFEKILKQAKLESERVNQARELLFAVAFSGLVSLAGPEVIIGAWLTRLAALQRDVRRTQAFIEHAGFVLSETTEAGLGAVAEGAWEKATGSNRPGAYEARRGGASAGEKHKEAFGNLTRMLAALPDLNPMVKQQHHVAMGAQQLAAAAESVGHGHAAKWTGAEITSHAEELTTVDVQGETMVQSAVQLMATVARIAAEVRSVKLRSARDFEQRLWTNWIASLEGDEDDALSNEVIFGYLGLDFEFGDDLSALEESRAVANARKKALLERGIDVSDAEDHGVAGRWQGEKALASIRPKVVGRTGEVIGRKGAAEVKVDGVTYSLSPGMRLVMEPGTRVRITGIEIGYANRTAILERWTGRHFEVEVQRLGE